MSDLLKTYRVYRFDADSGSVIADFVDATSDDAAIAMTMAGGLASKCEIWESKRLIGLFENVREEAR